MSLPLSEKFDEATKASSTSPLCRASSLTCPQKELSAFIEKEQAQARLNAVTQNMTAMCWDKCVFLFKEFDPFLFAIGALRECPPPVSLVAKRAVWLTVSRDLWTLAYSWSTR